MRKADPPNRFISPDSLLGHLFRGVCDVDLVDRQVDIVDV